MPTSFHFGRYRLLPASRELLLDGVPVPLGARAFDVLQALVERRDRLVTKSELLDVVWVGLVVEENNLQVQISTLRKLLGPQAIATVPGRGYRFALAETPADEAAAPAPAPPAPPAAPKRSGNVPSGIEAPIGRDAELAELAALVEAHRLVSIVGAGGVGKTRVGLALADHLRERFADGVWWVELAALTDPKLVAETIARTVGAQLAASRPADEALASALVDLDVLLVVDNCEHLGDSVSSVVGTVLAQVPTVRFVVTSQEPLRVRDETLFRLGTLAVPAADAAVDAVHASAYSAVRLFVERVRAVDHRFELRPNNVAGVAEICRRLDGIPLAIELAAARLPLVGVDGMRERLNERFRLLTAGARTVLRRHQTLRAALEWSHGLLSPAEQAVFRRLGVFAGGCTLAMAQQVASDAALDEWSVLDALGQLVDKSLVVADGGDAPRYRLLETTRAYALEQLAAAGETSAWLRRHAKALLDTLQRLGRGRWLVDRHDRQQFAAEVDNLRAALAWASEADGDRALAVALAAESGYVWYSAVAQAEGLPRVRATVPLLADTTPPDVAARFWLTHAELGVYSTNVDCFEAAGRAAELWRELGDDEKLYQALVVRAAIAGRRADAAAAATALAWAQRVENPHWPAHHRSSLAFAQWIVALNDGRYAEAREHAARQAALNRAAGQALSEQLALGNMAACDAWGGEAARAVPVLRTVIAEIGRLGYGQVAGHNLLNLAAAHVNLGEPDEALAHARRAYALLRREGDQESLLIVLVRLAAARGRASAALRFLGYARERWRALGLDDAALAKFAEHPTPIAVDAEPREALLAEGAALTEEQAFSLALADAD